MYTERGTSSFLALNHSHIVSTPKSHKQVAQQALANKTQEVQGVEPPHTFFK